VEHSLNKFKSKAILMVDNQYYRLFLWINVIWFLEDLMVYYIV